MTKLKLGIMSALVLTGLATALVIQLSTQLKLRDENESLLHENNRLSQLAAENERLSNLVAQASQSMPTTIEPARELLRLRGEVGALRRQNQELGKMLLRNQDPASAADQDKGFEPVPLGADAGDGTPGIGGSDFCSGHQNGEFGQTCGSSASTRAQRQNCGRFLFSEVSQGLEPFAVAD